MRVPAERRASIAAMAYSGSRSDEITVGRVIGWIVIGSLMFWPRLFLLGFHIFERQIFDAFDTWIVPFLGFFLLPWTTFAYAIMWGAASDRVYGFEWLVVAFAFLVDVYTWACLRD